MSTYKYHTKYKVYFPVSLLCLLHSKYCKGHRLWHKPITCLEFQTLNVTIIVFRGKCYSNKMIQCDNTTLIHLFIAQIFSSYLSTKLKILWYQLTEYAHFSVTRPLYIVNSEANADIAKLIKLSKYTETWDIQYIKESHHWPGL